MSRSTQVVGLKPGARPWLEENCEKEEYDRCPHCSAFTKSKFRTTQYARSPHGMFDDGPELDQYFGIGRYDGWIIREIDQHCEWSSGPVIFLCLELTNPQGNTSKLFEWSDVEIHQNL